jgi:predicted permease
MKTLRRFFTRLRNLAIGRRSDDRLREEIEEHMALQTNENIRAGLSPLEARRQAVLKFGAVEAMKEEYRGERRILFVENLVQDIRFGIRTLRKSPGFAAVAILTIAVGIGATTAIFSVVDATLLHPLPYPQPEQLARIQDDLPGVGAQDVGMSEPEWQDFQNSGIFDYVSPTWYDDNNVVGLSRPMRVSLEIVAPNYFSVLNVKPQLGRAFNPDDHTPGFTTEVMISDGLWKRAFGGDPGILGKNFRMDTDLYHVVGVMPPDFQDPGRTTRDRNIEVWAATSFYGAPMTDHPPRNGRNLPTAIGRLKAGLTVAAAQSRIDALIASLKKQFPADYPVQSGWMVRLVPLKEGVVGNVRASLILLLATVGAVLLIGCVNVANLLLARATARRREMAVRQALGAARGRLISQLLTESMLLSLLGGIAGLIILVCTKGFLLRLLPESMPRLNEVSISWGVLLFALGASLAVGVIFGLVPALHAGRSDLTQAFKQDGRGSTGSNAQTRARRTLVIAEFALSLVLMIAASLLLHSFRELVNAPLGFNPESVMTVRTRLPYPNDPKLDVYGTAAQQAPFFREVLRRSKTLPGVEEAAMGDLGAVPLGHDRSNQNPPVPLILEGREVQGDQPPLVDDSTVTPEYFHLMDMRLLRGRLFSDFDNEKTPDVAVINEAMAQTYWPHEDSLGKHLKISRRATAWTTVIGIVADARTESLEESRVPEIYVNAYQKGAHHLAIFLRGHLDAVAISEEVRAEVQAVDGTLPVFGAQMLNETVSASLAERKFSMEMVALFAVTALLLAALGIYGVISYIVNERTHEIGIRLALGAQKADVVRMVLREGVKLALAGSAIGVMCALVIARLMRGLLYGVNAIDPLTFAGVTLLLICVALVACYIPARRVMRVDPIVALRCD